MKLLRYGPAGHEKPGILDRDGHIVMFFNTPAMYRGFKLSDGRGETLLYK